MNRRIFARLVQDLSSEDFTKMESAANALSRLHDEADLPLIAGALQTGTPVVQRVMLWALQNYHIGDYTPYIPYLASGDANVREACQVLFMNGGRKAVAALDAASQSSDTAVQYAVAETLSTLRTPESERVLIRMLDAGDAGIRSAAAASLSVFRTAETADALCRHLTEPDTDTLSSMLYSLRDRELSSEQIAGVLPLISSPSEDIRTAAVYVLDAVTPDEAAHDESPRVRRAFAECTPSAALLEELCHDSDETVRSAAAGAAAKQHIDNAALFIPLLADTNPGVRRAAAEGLGNTTGDQVPAAIAALAQAIHDKRPGIRASAATALAAIRTPEAKAVLESVKEEKIPLLAGIIKNALAKFDE